MKTNQLKCSAAETENVIAQLFVGWAAQYLGKGQSGYPEYIGAYLKFRDAFLTPQEKTAP
jgi:hypothetical protein